MSIVKTIHADKASFSGLDRLSNHLTYHLKRQEVIASNLANLDTPGYRSRDLAFKETVTSKINDGKLSQSVESREELFVQDDEQPDQDGNSVSLERQVARSTSNTMRFRSLAELMNRQLGFLKYASTDGGKG